MTDDPTPGSLGKTSLQKVGGFTAVCVLVSNVIGSGIFTTTGFMARDLGHAGTRSWQAKTLLRASVR